MNQIVNIKEGFLEIVIERKGERPYKRFVHSRFLEQAVTEKLNKEIVYPPIPHHRISTKTIIILSIIIGVVTLLLQLIRLLR